ncbi:PrgI family protein [Candidatus Woesearchaeota archaeon]|nr:PrgI family protein [Candidatus Woesearchaeota archaeon]
MAYEIPSQLEYQEKIIFGLTFKQSMYAVIFGIIDFILFFKINTSIAVKCSLMILPTFLAGGFIRNLECYTYEFT